MRSSDDGDGALQVGEGKNPQLMLGPLPSLSYAVNPFHPHTSSEVGGTVPTVQTRKPGSEKLRYLPEFTQQVEFDSPVLSTLPRQNFHSYGRWPCIMAAEEFRSHPGTQSWIQVVSVSRRGPGSGRMQEVNIILGWFVYLWRRENETFPPSLDIAFGKLEPLNLWPTV